MLTGRWWMGMVVAWLGSAGLAWAQFGNPAVAVVNGEAIPKSDLEAILKQRPAPVTPLTAAQQRAIHEEIIAALVDETLIRQFLKKNTPPVDPQEITRQVSALQRGLAAQGKPLDEYLKETQQTEAQLRANIANMIQWNAYAVKQVTDEGLQKYYLENKDFFDKSTVKASHIVVRLSPTATPVEREEARQKLTQVRQEIVAGKITFAEAAAKYSQCPTAPKGGDLGFFARKWMVEEPFARAAFATKVGEITEVVVTEYGVHLIHVTDRKNGPPSDFSRSKDDVRDCFIEELRMNTLLDLRKKARIEYKK